MEIKVCKKCIMDTTDPDIIFDNDGICNHCKTAEEKLSNTKPYCLAGSEKEKYLQELVTEIKEKGKNKKYDCIIGVSGGVDSTYLAYKVKKLGLRPLAVHLDNGWNSELSVKNIENILNKLEIDLHTHVIDWEEFKDLQLSFLKASTPDSEIPTDHAIITILFQIAKREGVQYILEGTNLASESILPKKWSHGHSDWKYIKCIQKKFGTKKLKTFPHASLLNFFDYFVLKKIKRVHFLDYIEYKKEEAMEIIKKELEWKDYGGKHHESIYTKFFQAYILPEKFGFDKRKAHLSSLIVSNQITREDALQNMKKELYNKDELKNDIEYVKGKFGLSDEEFEKIMKDAPKTFWDYPSYENSWYFKFVKRFYEFLLKIKYTKK